MILVLLFIAPLPISPHLLADSQVAAAYIIFAVSYLVFALGKLPGLKIDRPGMAIIGAVLMVAFGIVRAEQALRFIDFGTLVLLFSMMLVVGCLHLAGFFEWITEQIVVRLKPHHLLPTVIFITGVLSAFFVNDIICLVMTPFALAATRRMGLKPLPYLLAVATASNIGSVATITGNPQNMLIGSFSGLSYRYFLWRRHAQRKSCDHPDGHDQRGCEKPLVPAQPERHRRQCRGGAELAAMGEGDDQRHDADA